MTWELCELLGAAVANYCKLGGFKQQNTSQILKSNVQDSFIG